MYYLCTAKRKTNRAKLLAQVAELVDAHVSGACAARCAGSSPALGTRQESLTINHDCWGFFFFTIETTNYTERVSLQKFQIFQLFENRVCGCPKKP